jgi:DNA-binding protein H-NS
MATSLSRVNAQIAKLQRQADALKAKEATGVISRIREAIDRYGLTASDLGLSVSRPIGRPPGRPAGGKSATRARSKTKGVVKYRDNEGNGWTGHGRAPSWYKSAIASGKTQADLLVK